MQEKLILFGGTGFVGSHVLQKALSRGYQVVVATRHGATLPGSRPEELSSHELLKFERVDATNKSQVFGILRQHADATMVISCIGVLSVNYDQAKSINGVANLNILSGVCDCKLLPRLKKFVYVSAEPFNEHLPIVFNNRHVLKGYFEGKQSVERVIINELKDSGVVLRPGFIYGTRYVTFPLTQKVLPLPLGFFGYPLHCVLRSLKCIKLLTPPVAVEAVAETAIRACAWASLPELNFSGFVDVYKMLEVCRKTDLTLESTVKTPKSGEGKKKVNKCEGDP